MGTRTRPHSYTSTKSVLKPEVRRKIFERDGWQCWFCGTTVEQYQQGDSGKANGATVEHLLPVNKGGDNDELNLVTACRTCNCQKGARTVEEYRAYLRYVISPTGRAITHLQSALEIAPSYKPTIRQIVEELEASLGSTVFYGEVTNASS